MIKSLTYETGRFNHNLNMVLYVALNKGNVKLENSDLAIHVFYKKNFYKKMRLKFMPDSQAIFENMNISSVGV